MKIAKNYNYWVGPYNITELYSLRPYNSSIIWFPELCPSLIQNPEDCSHKPIIFKEFKKLKNRPDEKIYIKKVNVWYLSRQIGLWTAIFTLLGSLIGLGEKLINKSDKPTITVHNGNNLNVIIHNDTKIHCDYEDLIGKYNGKKAAFRVIYLEQEKRWKYKSTTELNDGSLLKELLKNDLNKYPGIDTALGIISVGMASQEGNNKEKEEIRAGDRADEILYIIRVDSVCNGKKLYELNLGQHQGKSALSTSETAYQRRVVIIGVTSMDETMNFQELKLSLQNAFYDSEGLNFKIEKYSLFDFKNIN